MSRKPIPAFQEMNRGVDPEVLADLGYNDIPSQYTGDHDPVASDEAGKDANLDLLEAGLEKQIGQTAITPQKAIGERVKHPGPRKRFDPKTKKPASLASLGGRARAIAEVSDSWETK